MFKLVQKINDSSFPLCVVHFQHELYYKAGNELISLNGNSIGNFPIYVDQIKVFNDKTLMIRKSDDSRLVLFNHKISLYQDSEYLVRNLNLLKDTALLCFKSKNIFSSPSFFLVDINKMEVLWESSELTNVTGTSESIFSISHQEKSISKIDFTHNNILWKFELLKKFGEITNMTILGEFNDTLVVNLNEDSIIGIDSTSGTLLWNHSRTMNDRYKYDAKKNKLCGLGISAYFELDPKTGKLDRTDFATPGSSPIENTRSNFVFVDDHIVTTDSNNSIIGAFNTITREYDWIEEFEGHSFPVGSDIHFHNDHLFIQDSNGTLFVFKKV